MRARYASSEVPAIVIRATTKTKPRHWAGSRVFLFFLLSVQSAPNCQPHACKGHAEQGETLGFRNVAADFSDSLHIGPNLQLGCDEVRWRDEHDCGIWQEGVLSAQRTLRWHYSRRPSSRRV